MFRLLSCGYALGFRIRRQRGTWTIGPPPAGAVRGADRVERRRAPWPTCRASGAGPHGCRRDRRGGGADAVHRVRRVRPVGRSTISPWPTTLWATNATISAAILFGPIAGMLTGVAVMIASAVVKGLINSTWVETPRSSSNSRSDLRSGWPRRRLGVPTPNSSGPPGWRPRTRSASGCPGRYTTARSRCWRWCPAGP